MQQIPYKISRIRWFSVTMNEVCSYIQAAPNRQQHFCLSSLLVNDIIGLSWPICELFVSIVLWTHIASFGQVWDKFGMFWWCVSMTTISCFIRLISCSIHYTTHYRTTPLQPGLFTQPCCYLLKEWSRQWTYRIWIACFIGILFITLE